MIKSLLNIFVFIFVFNVFPKAYSINQGCKHFSINETLDTSKTKQNHYLAISPYYSYFKYLDKQISPILYKGNLWGINLGFESDGIKHKWNTQIGGALGNLIGETQNVSYLATEYLLNINLNYLFRIGKKESIIKKYIGLSFTSNNLFFYNTGLQNAALTYSSLNNIAFSSELEKSFSWKSKSFKIWFVKLNRRARNIKVNFHLDVPLYFLNNRPPYSSIGDFTDGNSSFDSQTKSFFIFNNAFQLKTATSLSYYFHNNNAIRISYLWQSFSFSDIFDKYQSAQHILEFSLLFRFNN